MLQFPKLNKNIRVGLQFALFLFIAWFFFERIYSFDWKDIQFLDFYSPYLFAVAILLMPVNWFLEGMKVYLNARQIREGDKFSFKSVLAGVSTGLITPNRLGNFVGSRQWFTNKKAYTTLNLYANVSQFVSTMIIGSVGVILLNEIPFKIPSLLFILLLLLGCLLYYNLPELKIKRFKWLEKYWLKIKGVHRIQLLILSLLRSCVISVQYTCFLLAFNNGEFLNLFLWTTVYYFYLTLIPSWFLNRLLIRESLALFVFLPLMDNSVGILISSLLLWILNLGIPALFGVYFLSKQNGKTHANIL